jgi:phosphatidate cytidylyltransferase
MEDTLTIQNNNSLYLRVVTALVGIPITLWLIYADFSIFFVGMLLILIGLVREISRMTFKSEMTIYPYVFVILPVFAFIFPKYLDLAFAFLGVLNVIGLIINRKALKPYLWSQGASIYVTTSILSLCLMSYQKKCDLIFLSLLIVWLADSGAYLIGSKVKGPKLAPKISPSKTWSGFVGGSIVALLGAMIFNHFSNIQSYFSYNFYLSIVILIIASHGGDLLESLFKRRFSVKDTGTIIPGHGGLLDRLDSILLVALIVPFLLK